MQVYARSKLANILFTTELARRLAGTGVTANSLHPGTVATGYARDGDATGFLAFGVKVIKPFILTPEKGARTSVYLASSPEVDGVTGQYFVKCRPRTPSRRGPRRGRRRPAVVGQRGAGGPGHLLIRAGAGRTGRGTPRRQVRHRPQPRS